MAQETVPTFDPPVLVAVGSFPYGLASGDVTGPGGEPDGYPELAVACGDVNLFYGKEEVGRVPGEVYVFRNTSNWNGTIGLSLSQVIQLPNDATAAEVALARIDDDDYPDLVISASGRIRQFDPEHRWVGAWGVYVAIWDWSAQQFDPFPDYYDTPMAIRGLAVGDFNGDGHNDVATAVDRLAFDPDGFPQALDLVYVHHNDGFGHLIEPEVANDVLLGPDQATDDLAAANFHKSTPQPEPLSSNIVSDNVTTLRYLGAGTYSRVLAQPPSPCTPAGDWLFETVSADRFTTGSLAVDLAGIRDDVVTVLHGNRFGGFGVDCTNSVPVPCFPSTSKSRDRYFLRACDPPPEPPIERHSGIHAGHLNGGPKPDLTCVTFRPSTAVLLLGQGNGAFQFACCDPAYYVEVDPDPARGPLLDPVQVLILDLNQDGFGDLVTSNHGHYFDDPNGDLEQFSVRSISVLVNAMQVVNP